MYTTTEGLYIVENNRNDSNLPQLLNFNPRKLTELTTINDLILTDSDFKTRQLLVIDKMINQNICKLQQTIIRSFKSHIDTYHMIPIQSNPMILYSTGQNVYIPTCQIINEIVLIEQTENCYNDIPIKFLFNNQTRYGYLTSNLIIKDTSSIKLCNLINELIILPKSKRIIERIHNKINVITQTNENILKLTLTAIDTNTINFKHNPQIANGIDIISIFKNIININDTGTIFKIIEDGPTTLLQNQLFNHTDYHSQIAYLLLKHLVPYMIVITSIVIIKLIILYYIFKCIINSIRLRFQNSSYGQKSLSYQEKIKNNDPYKTDQLSNQKISNENHKLSLANKFKKFFRYHNNKSNRPNENEIQMQTFENSNLLENHDNQRPKTINISKYLNSKEKLKTQTIEKIDEKYTPSIDSIKTINKNIQSIRSAIKPPREIEEEYS